jgi:hypothetical protein
LIPQICGGDEGAASAFIFFISNFMNNKKTSKKGLAIKPLSNQLNASWFVRKSLFYIG